MAGVVNFPPGFTPPIKMIAFEYSAVEEVLAMLRTHLASFGETNSEERKRVLHRVDHLAALLRYWDRWEDASLFGAKVPLDGISWEPLNPDGPDPL